MELIDYSYYKDVYCGSLDEKEFAKVYPKAQAYFYGATRGRVKVSDSNVCFALCELCDIFYEEISHNTVKSESCDGFSVQYKENENMYSLAWDVLSTYLEASGCLYGGNTL